MAGRTITVAQQKGGSGKTTVAVNLAVHLRAAGHSVAVLDTDPQGSLGRWFMTRVEATGGEPGMEFSTASAWGVGYECDKLRKVNDFVIVDTPPKADSDLRPALREADLVIVPVSASQLDLWATEAVLELVERTRKSALTVLNRARTGTRLSGEMVSGMQELDAPVAETVLGNRVIYAEALGQGFGVTERQRNSAAAREIAELWAEIQAILDA
ncbi:ParA family partition ATPase [Aliiruegeria lutimaris]|uniref:Chromosome partitioning protein n=1 Tax=Aliiruegeria lutimaris TaxID=571298 RepID=A0A1G8PIM2_9RHOB|nr:ParA family partition ATPase [Aliiruegeria lutimaris]SDI92282.1 chromosome partitioning protein [Aliiruegeria lutimaris]